MSSVQLSDIQLTLEQTPQQRVLHIVRIGYSYQLTNELAESDAQPDPFDVSINVIGDDLIRDDLLAESVDGHELVCAVGDSVVVERSLMVGQSLLDEDIGDDEIKLLIKVTRDDELLAQATTPIVRGRF